MFAQNEFLGYLEALAAIGSLCPGCILPFNALVVKKAILNSKSGWGGEYENQGVVVSPD